MTKFLFTVASIIALVSFFQIANATNQPLCYDVGVAYGPEQQGSASELDLIANHFSMIRIYHYDATTLNYAKNHGMSVILGTTNANAATYATMSNAQAFAAKIKPYIASGTIKVILLGNEPLNSPETIHDGNILQQAITNVYASLSTKIPVTINVSDDTYWGGTFDPRLNNYALPAISTQAQPIFFVDLYPFFSQGVTILTAKTTLENQISGWKTNMAKKFPKVTVAVAETGWASAGGNPPTGQVSSPANETSYISDAVSVAQSEHIPTFLFMAYDRAYKGSNWEGNFGLFKPGISIPSGLTTKDTTLCP